MTSRGPKRSASRVSTVVQTWHEHKLERHRSERLDEEVIRHQTRVSDDTGSENMFQMWPPAPDHFEGVRKTPMSANEKQQILVVGKQFNSAPTIIKCQIEARRSRLRRARSAALPILIGLIQCATLIACSAQRPAANNEPSGQQRLTTDALAANLETGQQQRLELDPLLVGHYSSASPSSDGSGETSESRLAQVAAVRAPFTSPSSSRHEDRFYNGRLVDSIAEPLQDPVQQPAGGSGGANIGQQQDKLNYIIDFLRHNRLTKFCDLLQSQDGRVRELIQQLNSMKQFTLFVPTNEALLLMSSSQLDSIEASPEETRQFLMAHATNELVVPRLNDPASQSLAQLTSKYSPAGAQNRWSSGRPLERIVQPASGSGGSQTLLYSLAGSPLRIITTPVLVATPPTLTANSQQITSQAPSTKLELIVNGANVLSGHSHALQEPNNTSVTYAIVHLVDRPLYPVPKYSLYERIQQVAPRFARLLQAAQDPALMDQLKSGARAHHQLTTGFVPNDDAFRSIPVKLLDQLETNRTYLRHFLRTHLVEGLYFSGQLAAPLMETSLRHANSSLATGAASSVPRLLTSMAGVELEFETKVIQSRQLILVNSIPILDQDQAVLNGAMHVIVRPIFERHLLDSACNCESSKLAPDRQTADLLKRLASEPNSIHHRQQQQLLASTNNGANGPSQRQQPTSAGNNINWFQSGNGARNELGGSSMDQLEREESQTVNSSPTNKIFRNQRSDNLVARNNRDFYRPSSAPANLALQPEVRGSDTTLIQDQQRRRLELQNGAILQPATNLGRGFISAGASIEPHNLTSLTNRQDEQLIRANQQQQQNWANGGNARTQPANADLTGLASASQSPDSSGELRPPSSFEVERYKIVMDANMRQKLREQQQQGQVGGLIMSSSLNRDRALQPADVFAYDQPLATPASSSVASEPNSRSNPNLWTYSVPNSSTTPNQTLTAQGVKDQVSSSASTQRHQRLLKFQAEDARDGTVSGGEQTMKTSSSQQFGSFNSSQSQRQVGKTVAPPFGGAFNGCAFYDTECKRLQMSGKFVRLPARSSVNSKFASQTQQLNHTGASHQANNYQPTTPSSIFDSSFGETTTTLSPGRFGPGGFQNLVTPPQHPSKNYMSFNPPVGPNRPDRVSPLNQPLPPWSGDEHKILGSSNSKQHQAQQVPAVYANQGQAGNGQGPNVNWRAQDIGDLSRIKLASGKLQQQQINSTRANQLQAAGTGGQPQQVLLIPVEMFQDSNISLASGRPRLSSQNQTQARPIYFAPPSSQLQAAPERSQQRPPPASLLFNSNSQYFTPTVQPQAAQIPSGPSQDRRPTASLGRLTNFTALEAGPSDGTFDVSSSAPPGASKQSPSSPVVLQGQKGREVTQPAYGNQAITTDEQRPLNESFQSAIQQARKIVRLQTSSPYQQPLQQQQPDRVEFAFGGAGQTKSDISITSARLTRPGNSSSAGGGLAVQASNQSPDVSGLALVRAPLVNSVGGSGPDSSASSQDFFQNRTIAEIMDDSGLRIDGQQVTFSRLRDCLDQADLSNLIVQQGSALTIFMPTDTAFQRLVQQQALMQQRTSRSSTTGTSSRLMDPNRRHLIPLVARAGSSRPDTSSASELSRLRAESSADSSLALAQRLTLDCSTQQVRQLLLDHLSAQLITPKQLHSDLVLGSLSGRRLLLSSVPSKKIVVVDGQPVIAATRAKNGMVYVVNKFLNISQQVPNVIDLLESQPNLKTFKSYLAFASLTDRLKRETGPVTIMAPTNEAFDQLSSAARQLLNSDPAAMMDILRGHIIEGAQFGKLISMRSRLKTMNADHFIEAKVIKPNVYQLDNQMTSMRLVGTAGNGVVNAIDRLVVPPWLRVSSGAATTGGNVRSASVPERSFNELDVDSRTSLSPGGSLRQPAAGLNLPLLNNRPLRFEQPTATARLAPTNSFSLTGSTTTIGPNQPLPDSFDVARPSSGLGPASFEPANLNNDSPFLRVANSTLNNQASSSSSLQMPAGGRLSSDFLNSLTGEDPTSPRLTLNSTKNMQLIEKLANLMKARKFIKYLVRSRLSELLKPDMNYVILVPTDQAIERLPKQIIDVLERDQDRLSDLVNFHVLDTTFEYINTIPDGQTLNTLNEKDILFNWHRNNTILTASGAVVMGGIQDENIALLIVDRVLYPTPGDLLSIVTKSPILSNFTNLIRNAGLERQLSLAGPFTLFAPSDFAFNQLDKRDLDFLQNNRDSARRFLLRHLSQPAIFTSSIALSNATDKSPGGPSSSPSSGSIIPLISVTNSLGEELTLRQKNDYFSVNDVNFSYADVAATNGVVHVIDGLL